MLLSQIRWLSAAILAAIAVLGTSLRSEAGTQILIEEVDQNRVLIAGTAQYFTGTSASYATPNFAAITVTATPNSGAIGSLTTSVNSAPAANFDTSHQLLVVVTSDGFTTPNLGGNATVQNNAAASSGIDGGQNILSNNTQLFSLPLNPDTTSTTQLAGGTALGASTGEAVDIRPNGGISPTTTASITGIPGSFAIQQTIYVRVNQTNPNGIASGSTLGGSASSTVITSAAPVPAPAGVVLAMAAVPVFGLRRLLRRKSAI